MAAPFLSSSLSKPSARLTVPELKKGSRNRDLQTSKSTIGPFPSLWESGPDSSAQARPEPLAKKERNHAERGQKRTVGKDSFLHMQQPSWTHGAAWMALGAVAVWLGKEAGNGSGFLIPACFVLSAVLAFLGWQARGNLRRGRFASASPASGDLRFHGPAEAGGAALLSHEMKNYLCTLKGNAHLLRQRIPGDDQAIIDRIDRVVEKLESFTRQLGNREAATALGAMSPLSSAQIARASARTHFHKRIDAFRFSEDPSSPSLLCDPGRLDQVFLNLYSNALEAGASRIDTAIRREGGKLVLRIEDDGRGCAEEDLARIFEPFFTTKSGPARRGLGMFIVQSIVENHGGSVRVETKNDSAAGSTGLIFTLEFPHPRRAAVSTRPAPLIAASDSAAGEWMLSPPVALR